MSDRSSTPLFLPLLCAGAVGAVLGALVTQARARRARRVAQARLLAAASFAAERHCDQRRKNPRAHPYINHPLRVASRLASTDGARGGLSNGSGGSTTRAETPAGVKPSPDTWGAGEGGGVDDVEVLIAALLHDTVEDTDTTLGEISELFGPRVARLVDEVSDDKTLPKMERKRLQIEHAPLASHGAKLVKLSDKLDNLSDLLVDIPVGWKGQRVEEYFEWSQKVVTGLRGTNAVLEGQLDAVFERSQEAVQAADKMAASNP